MAPAAGTRQSGGSRVFVISGVAAVQPRTGRTSGEAVS